MSCHQQHGTRAYVSLMEAAIGEQINQVTWHAFRKLTEQDSGATLTKTRASDEDKSEAFLLLNEAVLAELDPNSETYIRLNSTGLSPESLLDGIVVTEGTLQTIRYVARNGVAKTVQRVQAGEGQQAINVNLQKFAVNEDYPFPQANSIPKLASSVDAIEAGADTDESIAMSLGVTDRQGAYYGTALGYLGLAQETGDSPRTWGLTANGADFLNSAPADRVEILTHLYEQVGQKVMTTPDGEGLSDSTEERRENALQSCQKYLETPDAAKGVSLEADETRGRTEGAAAHATEQRKRVRDAAVPAGRTGATCGTCFTTMPLSGTCDNCD